MSTLIIKLGPTFATAAQEAGREATREEALNDARSAFQRDARHFLKQVANRLKLRSHQYTISTRAAAGSDRGEVILRGSGLMLVVSMRSNGAHVSFARYVPGVTVLPEDLRHVPLARLAAPGLQRAFLSWCEKILQPAQAAPEPPADVASAG